MILLTASYCIFWREDNHQIAGQVECAEREFGNLDPAIASPEC
jgi:hypothetical protein